MKQRKSLWQRLSPPQTLSLGFVIIILTGTFLLMMPHATESGAGLSFLDALFMSTSSVCVTGLAVVDPGTTFTLFGQLVILALIQIGGLGFMTMATLIALVFRKRISFKERLILLESTNQASLEGIVKLIRRTLIYALIIELAGALILSIRWALDMPLGQAIYFGIFHSVSMFTNAGFDIMGGVAGPFSSLASHVNDPIVNLTAIVLIFLGGIGFVVLADVWSFRLNKRLTLHSKVVLLASAGLFTIGTIVILLMEFTNPNTLGPLGLEGKLYSASLHSISPRSGGISTLDVAQLRQSTQFFIIILMFIGAAPGSTGGGIKLTTFVILVWAVVAMARGKNDIVILRHRLAQDRIYKAITITVIAVFVIVSATMIMSTFEDRTLLPLLFEVTSAFGTTGMSMGLTPNLTDAGKVLIITMMFIGRLGPLTLAYTLAPTTRKELYRHPEGKIMIG
ncbi:TrkH family potassium uptake protein [Paenibacillus sp. GCM10023252]|uniref:TrkH family potassium uptake protein n=1 Tax=Paenibacillus sp. GCM10023252 TaxID=3252649 RepID=UPI00361CDBE3